MKLDVSEIKKNTILEIDGQLFKVVDFSFMQMQQRQGSYSFKMKNLVTGSVQTFVYKSGSVIEKWDVATNNAIYLYHSWDTYSFMENDSGEMYDLDKSAIEDVLPYLKENLELFLMTYKGQVLNVLLPNTISYTVTTTVPGIKGDRAKTGKKPATIETGMEVMIPLHKVEGDTITVNTITGETV